MEIGRHRRREPRCDGSGRLASKKAREPSVIIRRHYQSSKRSPEEDELDLANGEIDPTRYEELLGGIVRNVVPGLGPEEPGAEVPLNRYGVGSLMLAGILTEVEERFDIVYETADDLGDSVSVRALAAQLDRKIGRSRHE